MGCLYLASCWISCILQINLLVLELVLLVTFGWAGNDILGLRVRVGAGPLLEENLSAGLLVALAHLVHCGGQLLRLLWILLLVLLREGGSSAWGNDRATYWHLGVQDLGGVVHSSSRSNDASLVVPLSLLAIYLWRHGLRCLRLLRRVDFTGPVRSVGRVLTWPQWASRGAHVLAWDAVA